MLRKIRAMMLFSRAVEWVSEPKWEVDDAKAWSAFLKTNAGKKLSLILLNMVVKTNAQSIQNKKDLAFEAGFANGFRGAVASLEGLANSELYRGQDNADGPEYPEL